MDYSKNLILIISPVHQVLIKSLKKSKKNFEYLPNISEHKLKEKIINTKVLILRSGVNINNKLIKSAKKLKLILRAGSGLDNIDIIQAKKQKIKVENIAGLNARSVAEFGFGLIFAVLRNIVNADKEIRKNIWKKTNHYGLELKSKTIGIIGLGNIGTEVAKISKSFGLKVIANVKNKKRVRKIKVPIVNLLYLLRNSDIIVFCVPLTNKTKNLLNKSNSKIIKKDSIIINLSRGGVVDEDVLYNLLQKNKLFGAASDVFLHEKKLNKLFKLKNIVVTPHIGAMTFDAQRKIAERVFVKLKRFLG